MGATTRWKDNQTKSMDDAIEIMCSSIKDDDRGSSVYRRNFSCRKLLEENSNISLNGQNIKYNIIKYKYEQVTPQEDPADDRSIPKNGFIVILEKGGGIYYIIDQNTSAKRLLRKLLSYEGRNEIEDASFNFGEDFFIWIVNRVYNSADPIENSLGENTKILQLEEIKGIKGNIEDLQTTVSTSGEAVMKVISTLSFLLESRRVNQVVLKLRYTDHENIDFKLQKNTIGIESPYIGAFLETYLFNEELYGKIYLLLYYEILPLLEQEYRMDLDEKKWGHQTYATFLTGIKNTIIEKIEEKIESL